MDVLILSRGVPDPPAVSDEDDRALTERHWTYMDTFVGRFTARGPTMGPGRDSWIGSLHVVDLSGLKAVKAFVQEEPYERRGLFAEHRTWRFDNLLGRTMWDFARESDDPTFLVVALGAGVSTEVPDGWVDRLVMHGSLRRLQDDEPAGVALIVQAPSRPEVEGCAADLGSDDVEVHDWQPGGRR
jgi:uncharacterized protein YciI